MIKFQPNEKTLSSTSRLINCVIQNITEGDDLIIKLWHIRKMDAADGCVENGMMLSILWSLSWDFVRSQSKRWDVYVQYTYRKIYSYVPKVKMKILHLNSSPIYYKINIMQFQSIFLLFLAAAAVSWQFQQAKRIMIMSDYYFEGRCPHFFNQQNNSIR